MGKVLDPEEEPVIKRCIHTTADFEYADSLVFSDRAVERGLKALKAGAHIVTDTRMGFSGVNKGRLEKLGGEALCFMADPDVAEIAAREGCTRATASMDKAAVCTERAAPGSGFPASLRWETRQRRWRGCTNW